MTKLKIVLFVIALPVFLGAMFYLGLYLKNKGVGTVAGPGITPPNTIDVATPSGPSALLVKESGVVTYKLPETSEIITLEQNEINVPTGTTVKTGTDTFAHVVFPNNSLMSLSKDTEVVLDYEENKIKVFQLLGNTWHRVEKVLEGQSYEVETPNTLATVRGTEFNVGILNGETELYVMESTVEATKIAKENGETVAKETKKVTKDEHVLIPPPDSKNPIKLVALPASKRNTDWFKRNTKLTEKIKEAEEVEKKESEKDPDKNSDNRDSFDKDFIKKNVRKKFMDQIKDDEDLKKIDNDFGIRRSEKPTSEPTKESEKNTDKNSRTENKKDDERVLGANTSRDSESKDSKKSDEQIKREQEEAAETKKRKAKEEQEKLEQEKKEQDEQERLRKEAAARQEEKDRLEKERQEQEALEQEKRGETKENNTRFYQYNQ